MKALEHEAFLSDELVRYWPWVPFTSWKRCIKTDRVLRPDAEIPNLLIEFDRGNERKKIVQKQAAAEKAFDGFVVWIVPETKQMDWVFEANSDNTFCKLHGTSELFNADGRTLSVEELCRRIMSRNVGN